MNIRLITYTPQPEKSIAAAMLNMGIGFDCTDLDQISDAQAQDALREIFASHLDAPLEYASFNFFWEDIPLFLRAHLVRHRVGWGFAERSLRFYDANLRNPVEHFDFAAIPTVRDVPARNPVLGGRSIASLFHSEMERQMEFYRLMLEEGIDQQDARTLIGTWYPTAMQTTCTYRALRAMLADRLSSQAHPFWQQAALQIKALVTRVAPALGAALVDSCEIHQRCVWNSRLDRQCDACVARGRKKAHEHIWDRATTLGENTQCACGTMRPKLLSDGRR
jgi:thymidylate synthase (FAD)